MALMVEIQRSAVEKDLPSSLWKIVEPSKWVNLSMENDQDGQNHYWVDLPGRFPYPRYPETCGKFRMLRVCQVNSDHKQMVFNHCAVYDCPICWNTWKAKAAYRVSDRIFQWAIQNDIDCLYHWVVSPPKDFDLDQVKKVEKALKRIFQSDVHGYTLIFHCYRGCCLICGKSDEECKCYMEDPDYNQQEKMEFRYSPHWHMTSDLNYIPDIADIYEVEGFVLKRLSKIPLNDLFKLFAYELGHCSKLSRKHAIKYWGLWSYSQMKCLQKVIVQNSVSCKDESHESQVFMDDWDIIDYRDDDENSNEIQFLIEKIGLSMTRRHVNLYYAGQFYRKLVYWIKYFNSQFQFPPNQFILDILEGYKMFK